MSILAIMSIITCMYKKCTLLLEGCILVDFCEEFIFHFSFFMDLVMILVSNLFEEPTKVVQLLIQVIFVKYTNNSKGQFI